MLEQETPQATKPAQGLMARLKAETRMAHDAAEAMAYMKELMAGELPLETYGKAVNQLGIVRAGLEEALDTCGGAAAATVYQPYHAQSPLYQHDSKHWGAAGEAALPATRKFLQKIAGWCTAEPAALLGALYVLEGSNMGSTIIRKRLLEVHELPAESAGFSALNPHDRELMNRWRRFAADMDSLPLSPEQKAAVIQAARDTFDAIAAIHGEVYLGDRKRTAAE